MAFGAPVLVSACDRVLTLRQWIAHAVAVIGYVFSLGPGLLRHCVPPRLRILALLLGPEAAGVNSVLGALPKRLMLQTIFNVLELKLLFQGDIRPVQLPHVFVIITDVYFGLFCFFLLRLHFFLERVDVHVVLWPVQLLDALSFLQPLLGFEMIQGINLTCLPLHESLSLLFRFDPMVVTLMILDVFCVHRPVELADLIELLFALLKCRQFLLLIVGVNLSV